MSNGGIMMNIDLVALIKQKEVFFNCFREGDQYRSYNGKSLIFYSIANSDLSSRYDISNFLLDKEVDVINLNSQNESVLHVLLAQVKHDLDKTIKLCKIFINRGVDINTLDNKGRVAFQYILNMKFSDEQLNPLYDMWFSQPHIELTIQNAWGLTPIDLAMKISYRKKILERMEKYVQKN